MLARNLLAPIGHTPECWLMLFLFVPARCMTQMAGVMENLTKALSFINVE
jgi:hypothetical protein